MRFFNTEGPVRPDLHYHIPPLERVDLDALFRLVRDQRYFVLHAPRQTGKTSTLLALREELNRGSAYRCVYANVEVGQAAREDTARAMRAVLGEFARRARTTLGDETLDDVWPGILERVGPDGALGETLSRWCAADAKPLVLLIDEIDALVGDTLLSVLRQLRAGYDLRPEHFPHSIVLCGLRDVRDCRIHSGAAGQFVLGGSAFNIKSKSLRLGDFGEPELQTLLAQHTAETGQSFEEAAVQLIWTRTMGQPWLVNALCREACFDSVAGRIRRVVEPILTGATAQNWTAEDVAYACDLGLVAQDAGGTPGIANPIYAEVVPRHLNNAVQAGLLQEAAWYVDAEGNLDVDALMAAFQRFFREHSEHWVQRFDRYHEAGPQLLLQAFLQRVVNGGGRIEREYALGRGRVDLLIVWPAHGERRIVVECRIRHGDLEKTVAEGVAQTQRYMDRSGADTGHLIVFDRSTRRTWDEKVFRRDVPPVTVWGM